ncbi:MAG: TlyA family RNA methyltransferase [Oscillospiraceae bacterium]|jgi:23S rRNA (cytidine1920-2'-O)/16S rRNA (cytidine1409-2'-O)-methyltransferase|nr:TlyA family RNA methyltransferase [Oscillospiraceae bacterium]
MNRLDKFLAERSLAKSRSAAAELIANNSVAVNGVICKKPSRCVGENDIIEIVGERPRYVSRGGLKLRHALEAFGIDLNGLICLDVGASTGGFTDCMLQEGAKRVYAVDVGTGQLDSSLRADERVVSLERLDIRKADRSVIPAEIDFAAVDVSFISLKLVLPELKRFLKNRGSAAVLIKPQFELGKKRKNAVDKAQREKIAADTAAFSKTLGFAVSGVIDSPVPGGSGNREFLMRVDFFK